MNGPRRHTPDLLGAGGYGNGPSDFMFFGKIGEDKRGEDSLATGAAKVPCRQAAAARARK